MGLLDSAWAGGKDVGRGREARKEGKKGHKRRGERVAGRAVCMHQAVVRGHA